MIRIGEFPRHLDSTLDGRDYQIIKNWLRNCKLHHGECHTEHGEENLVGRGRLAIRLIDVTNWKIVEASTTWNYFALSYVWGQISNLCALTANVEELGKDRARCDGSRQEARLSISMG